MQTGASSRARLIAILLAVVAVVLLAVVIVTQPRSQAETGVTELPSIAASQSPSASTPSSAGASVSPSESAAPSPSTVPAPDPVLVGAGDIATCDRDYDEQTAALAAKIPGIVFTIGDNAYPNGSRHDFNQCFDPSWGRLKDRIELPVVGNHDWLTSDAAAYKAYFGDIATPDGATYYSRDIDAWHVIVLDANCEKVAGGCGRDSPQVQWLRADLAAHPTACTLALFHQPLFSSGSEHGNDPAVRPFWRALYAAGADLVLNGHDHDYERFAPQDPDGDLDRVRGITEIVAGTGGGELRPMGETQPHSIVRRGKILGVLKLTLHADGWTWRFISTDGSFGDRGVAACH